LARKRIGLDLREFENTLELFEREHAHPLDIEDFHHVQAFALGAIAALSRPDLKSGSCLELVPCNLAHEGSRWAWDGMGLAELIDGTPLRVPGEPGRTAKLRRIDSRREVGAQSSKMAALVAPRSGELQRVLGYVFDELLRNVLQHSHDALGGIACAQRMDPGSGYPHTSIQLVVADNGIGIRSSLASTFGEDLSAHEALVHSMEPHVSGAFSPGAYGSHENAGLGLFVVSEIVRRTAGRLMLATRGGSIFIEGDADFGSNHRMRKSSLGYPGTLAAFELPIIGKDDSEMPDLEFQNLLAAILRKADEQRQRSSMHRVINYESPPAGARHMLVAMSIGSLEASATMRAALVRALERGESICLSFLNVALATQSQIHALLFDVIRRARDLNSLIWVEHCAPEVVIVLDFVQGYALST